MNDIGRLLIIAGIILIIAGAFFILFSKFAFFGKLPGDIHIQRENFGFYFPLSSCLLISLILSVIFLIIRLIK